MELAVREVALRGCGADPLNAGATTIIDDSVRVSDSSIGDHYRRRVPPCGT